MRWTAQDRDCIAAEGLNLGEVERQLDLFRRGPSSLQLDRPCVVGDGIEVLGEDKQERLLALYERVGPHLKVAKFVPASGAASRMFAKWYEALGEGRLWSAAETEAFFDELPRYAFYEELQAVIAAQGADLAELIRGGQYRRIIGAVLDQDGLNYGRLPKALLKFHRYGRESRTALEEHLVEAYLYARDANNRSHLHLTVSLEHEEAVRSCLATVLSRYETSLNTSFEVGVSVQERSTNTLAVDSENNPFRDENGRLLFRPGGHGALLKNLDGLKAHIVFLKNIDNVVPDRLKGETVRWKKILAGLLISLQEEVYRHLDALEKGATGREVEEMAVFCREKLYLAEPASHAGRPVSARRQWLHDRLHRPLRVCGMVRNQGEPGGGPFWVAAPSGEVSLQIVEQAQVDLGNESQRRAWEASTHFNPVDLVCGLYDHKGRKYDLGRFVDQGLFFVSFKSYRGSEIKILEWPGLWNGSMAKWNTIFVEVPLVTFNPVKTVNDLLRPQHFQS